MKIMNHHDDDDEDDHHDDDGDDGGGGGDDDDDDQGPGLDGARPDRQRICDAICCNMVYYAML